MLTGRRYLLALTPEQEAYAERIGDACRAVWNTGLEQRREWLRRGRFMHRYEQITQMIQAKREFAWLTEPPKEVLEQTLIDLDRACRQHGTFSVRWRSRYQTRPTFRLADPRWMVVQRVNRRWGRAKLPKFGWVRFRWTRPVGGTIRNATVRRDGGRWYISFCVEDGLAEVAPNGKPAVGVDRGVRVAFATSEGSAFDQAETTIGTANRLKRLQQQLARQKNKHSSRRRVTRQKLAALSGRIRNRRTDFTAQTAVRLVRAHGLVAVEDLRVKDMTRSAKGTVEQPGRNVRQKAGLNRAIRAKGWGQFVLKLEHAARYHGATVVKVNPVHTSLTCYVCKHIAKESRESQAVFRCVACGHQDNADVNAAKNIRERGIELASAAGLAVAGRGDFGAGRSAKRQPITAFSGGSQASTEAKTAGGCQASNEAQGGAQTATPHTTAEEAR